MNKNMSQLLCLLLKSLNIFKAHLCLLFLVAFEKKKKRQVFNKIYQNYICKNYIVKSTLSL